MSAKPVVVGIDLGAGESYVAYVGKGIVDIVQNEVSKRATSTLVGFTDRERLLGDAALAQIRSNAKNTCRNFKHLLGRKVDAPDVAIENFWSTSKLCECADGHAGYDVMYKGEPRQMSAVEVTAMYLTRLREITEKWCEGKVNDVVISVPSAFSDVQRQAVLDAAKIANISVLRLMNEHTATALAYGIYRSNDFDPEKPMTVAFCSMGVSIFSVSIVQFVRGKLNVVVERSDKVGGRELDECLMREFASQFKKKVGCDPLSNKKASFKLEDAVSKTKKILSANNEAGVNCECLMEDEDFASNITRADLEEMCKPAMERVTKVLQAAIAASGLTLEQIDSVEIVGGGSRVPWVKRVCSEAFGGKDLSTTMNQEESVARGCALQAAILSPLYKVRDFKVDDTTQFAVNVGWMGSAADSEATKEEDGDTNMGGGEGEYKTATVFPAGSNLNVLKMLTFYRKGPFDVKAEYADEKVLLPMTPKELGTFKIELPPQTEAKKIKVRAKLTLHGTFTIEGAQMVEEEEYEETVKEKRELPPDETPAEAPAEGEAKPAEGEKEGEEKKEEKKEPKYEWVDVKKMKKRTKKTDLKVTAVGTPGLPADQIQKLMDAESAMQAEMREIIETDEKRNDLEGYIFNMRDRTSESGEYGAFISSGDRDQFSSDLMKAEDWLYDNPDATKTQYIDKLEELKRTGDAVVWRSKEHAMRPEWIQAVTGTISNYRNAAQTPGDKYGHIAPEKLQSIVSSCNQLEQWLKDMQAKQETMPKHEKPVLICADMEKKNQELAKQADDILKEPKPAPPKEEKKEEAPAAEEKKDEQKADAPAPDANDVD
mmetsp:Transcript_145668/g.369668  ORF Transcript_145668/g.369668 Transcript_145668/m.369668 type:complete len:826 (+) Transcript_145668:122-2599(+)